MRQRVVCYMIYILIANYGVEVVDMSKSVGSIIIIA